MGSTAAWYESIITCPVYSLERRCVSGGTLRAAALVYSCITVAVFVSYPQQDQSDLLAVTVFAPFFTYGCLKFEVLRRGRQEERVRKKCHVSHLHE